MSVINFPGVTRTPAPEPYKTNIDYAQKLINNLDYVRRSLGFIMKYLPKDIERLYHLLVETFQMQPSEGRSIYRLVIGHGNNRSPM